MASIELTRRWFLMGKWTEARLKNLSPEAQVKTETALVSIGVTCPLAGFGEAFWGRFIANDPFMERIGLNRAWKYSWTTILAVPLIRRLRPLDHLVNLTSEK